MTTIKKKAAKNTRNNRTGENSKKYKYLEINLVQIPYIQYSIIFKEKSVLMLFDSRNEVNIIYPSFTKKLGFSIK